MKKTKREGEKMTRFGSQLWELAGMRAGKKRPKHIQIRKEQYLSLPEMKELGVGTKFDELKK